MSQEIINLLNKGAEANKSDSYRRGNVIYLPAEGELVCTGDLHGHRRNFERIVTFADLENNPNRHVVLQEIIHGGPEDSSGGCVSYRLLFDIVRYKLQYPSCVHIILGNHDTAYITNSDVMKNGKEMNRSMRAALDREFKDDSGEVKDAIAALFLSQPLAVRSDNRIWMSHSLVNERDIGEFDLQVFEKELTPDDMLRPKSIYLFTWSRNHSQQLLDKTAEMLDVDLFILGHQAQTQGWCRAGKNLIIVASDHNHGCLLPVNLEKPCSIEQLIDSIVPLASIA